jgi:hypothetical protein
MSLLPRSLGVCGRLYGGRLSFGVPVLQTAGDYACHGAPASAHQCVGVGGVGPTMCLSLFMLAFASLPTTFLPLSCFGSTLRLGCMCAYDVYM